MRYLEIIWYETKLTNMSIFVTFITRCVWVAHTICTWYYNIFFLLHQLVWTSYFHLIYLQYLYACQLFQWSLRIVQVTQTLLLLYLGTYYPQLVGIFKIIPQYFILVKIRLHREHHSLVSFRYDLLNSFCVCSNGIIFPFF